MSDLVRHPEDWFSQVMAQINWDLSVLGECGDFVVKICVLERSFSITIQLNHPTTTEDHWS